MLKIRLTRRGKKNKAFFRLVVAEHTSPVKGKFLENLGFLNPHTKEKGLKEDRIKYWLERGAQCSDSAHNLLVSSGILRGPKRTVKIKKKVSEDKKEEIARADKGTTEPVQKAMPNEVSGENAEKEEVKTEKEKTESEKKEEEKKE